MKQYYVNLENGKSFVTWEHNIKNIAAVNCSELCIISRLLDSDKIKQLNAAINSHKNPLHIMLKNLNVHSIPVKKYIESHEKFIAVKNGVIFQNKGSLLRTGLYYRDNRDEPIKIVSMYPISDKNILLTCVYSNDTRVLNIHKVFDNPVKYIAIYPSNQLPIKNVFQVIDSIDNVKPFINYQYSDSDTASYVLESIMNLC